MTLEIYLKSGQTIVLDHVDKCEFKQANNVDFTYYSIEWEVGWKRKITALDLTQIAAVCRVEE